MPANHSYADRLKYLIANIAELFDPANADSEDPMTTDDLFPETITFNGTRINQEQIQGMIGGFYDSFEDLEVSPNDGTQVSGMDRISQRVRVKGSWFTRFMEMVPMYKGIEVEFNVEVTVVWGTCRITSVNCAVDRTNLMAASLVPVPEEGWGFGRSDPVAVTPTPNEDSGTGRNDPLADDLAVFYSMVGLGRWEIRRFASENSGS